MWINLMKRKKVYIMFIGICMIKIFFWYFLEFWNDVDDDYEEMDCILFIYIYEGELIVRFI